ncbi:MAG: carbonic anhydrase family protein [Candidatus Nitrohelix vancouverensis]|uniref:carbonic anhydrase n=1 Tax=Candidatus Nitrohelix vancouverensis TaxID=2705534 RepID=A0A7T0G438_9BACT|nr:MAG: carbonic anhydrase family protein [Candidatus Nitrohelix vancouverensis]
MQIVPIFFFIFMILASIFSDKDNSMPVAEMKPTLRLSDSVQWSYSGTEGPEHWGELSSAFKTCSSGMEQSPVNFSADAKTRFGGLEFHYNKSPLRIINNGNSIDVNYAPGSYVLINGKQFNLVQFHIHHPGEHTIDGVSTDMELHLIHEDDKKNLAVVGVFLERGTLNPYMKPFWDNLPETLGEEITVPGETINAEFFLPLNREYFSYPGSLTTPPCKEGVQWFVMKNPVDISVHRLSQFRNHILFNSRPVQDLNGRL